MIAKKVTVCNPNGLHLKPAGHLCNVALTYECSITIHIREKYVNAKSVLGVLSACIKYGDEIEIICNGDDEETAMEEILQCINRGLGEQL
ncbi:MAG: HPr family phosphocarrier protein [bacterium]|nr:HPr family phosphocarrier protein [bacterium]